VAERGAVRITDSLVDAALLDPGAETAVAYAAPGAGPVEAAGAALQMENVTVVGKVHTRHLEYASNSLFYAALREGDAWPAPVHSERKQAGCVRFSTLPVGSRVPRRYRCQPDLAIHQALTAAEKRLPPGAPPLDDLRKAAIARGAAARVQPRFTELRYGRAAYGRLHRACPKEIRTGADDESEMGAFHDNYQPQRETNLRLRLEEYLRFGLEAGLIYAGEQPPKE
jgi:hypothetical protein